MKNLNYKIENFKKATLRLNEACLLYDIQNDIVQDSIIQRFEFTFSLAVAAMKSYLENQGVVLEETYPRSIFKIAFKHGLIHDEDVWIGLLLDRNLTSHIYNQSVAQEISERIVLKYLTQFQKLLEKLAISEW